MTRAVRNTTGRILRPEFDEVLALHASLRWDRPGVMVDVGAHHGRTLRPFAEDGWQVIAFEPDPQNRAVLLGRVARWPNVSVDGRAIGVTDGDIVSLFTSDVSTGISTLVPFHPTHRPTAQVETVRLDTYLAGVHEVTVIKTDAEGYDLPILQTFPWGRLHPRAVVCEFEDRRSAALGYDHRDMAQFLLEAGYAVLVSEWYPVVEYGRAHRWRTMRRYPAHLQDPNGWGNLIAIEPDDAESVLRQAGWGARMRLRSRSIANLISR